MSEASQSANARVAGNRQPIFDCDVHPVVRGGIKALFPYMSQAWQRKFHNRDIISANPLPVSRYSHPGSVVRADAVPPGGGSAGSDPSFTVKDYMDPYGVDQGLLIPIQAGGLNAWVDADEAATLARAFNHYFVEHWLPVDKRFQLCIAVAPQDPQLAAEEIRYWSQTKQVAAVYLPMLNILYGNRYYYPIYAAAAECGLPIISHATGTEGSFLGAPVMAGGLPSSYVERYVGFTQIAQANLVSLIFEGVFERFPTLKVAFVEWGFSWAVPVLWRADKAWRGLRRETPWVKRLPSEYVQDHVRFTTEPIDEPEKREHLHQLLEMMWATKTVMFSSDYPHWDNDTPNVTRAALPESLRHQVLYQNAMDFFGHRIAQ